MVSFGCSAHPLKPFDGRAGQSYTPLHLCIFDYIWDLNSLACNTIPVFLHCSCNFFCSLMPLYIFPSSLLSSFGNFIIIVAVIIICIMIKSSSFVMWSISDSLCKTPFTALMGEFQFSRPPPPAKSHFGPNFLYILLSD